MDLRLGTPAKATAAEQRAVDSVLGAPSGGWDGGLRSELDGRVAHGGHQARRRRHQLLPVLHALQREVGWISPGALDYVCTRLTVPPAEAYGVVAFYALLRTQPGPETMVHICDDLACRCSGAEELCRSLAERFGPPGVGPGAVGWQRSPCLGRCEQGSAALIQRSGHNLSAPYLQSVAPVSLPALEQALRPTPAVSAPAECAVGQVPGQGRLLGYLNSANPLSLGAYRARGGFQLLRRALQLGPTGVISEVKAARLLGRGGAAFPTGVKWEAVAANPSQPHYFICNADESEPGTFKDRVLLTKAPFAVIEALTIAGFATGSRKGYLYIRGEYPEAAQSLEEALEACQRQGYLGTAVLGSAFSFDIEVRRGGGAYIAGEETGLFNSIEGRRPEPRNKPPFPAQSGLFGSPTGVNNVETLLNVLEVLRLGGETYAALGTELSTGTRLFCLSGCVQRPGLYEAEFGCTLGELIELAGGLKEGRSLQAVLLGGAAGSFVGPSELSMPLTFEDSRSRGATLGSGVVLVLDETIDLVDLLRRIAQFFRDESCGQCVPCRVGTVRQEELLSRLADGHPLGSWPEERQLLEEIGQVMRDASICGLGQTAATAIASALDRGLLTLGQPS